jgi:hypothetical protein
MSPTPTPASPRTTRRRWAILTGLAVAGVAVLVLAFAAFSPSSPSSSTAGSSPAPSAPFTAATASGQQLMVPGGKPSAIFFFSANCGTCAQQANPDAANYVAVDVDPNETTAEIAAFLTDNQAATLAVTSDTTGRLIGAYQVTQLGTMVVLDPDGQVVSRAYEPTTAQIQDMLNQAGAR